MGNKGSWSRFSAERLEKSEKKLMEFSGVTLEKFKIEVSTGNFMHCLRCGNESNPIMVILHGYCGSSLIFYKTLKRLSEIYNIYLIDHIGMGQSSRPSFKAQSTFEAESFFVEALEICRQQIGIESFILAGHSLGGYISGCYALRYPKYVTKLLLLSPGGIYEKPTDHNPDRVIWTKFSWINKFVLFFWLQDISLIEFMRKLGPFSGLLMKNYMRDKYNLPEEEMVAVEEFLEQINLLPGSGECAISYILDFELWPYSPLCKRFANNAIPVAFFYGDRDWMGADGGYKTKQLNPAKTLVYTISNSDHHMYWDNPEELVDKMLESLQLMDVE